MSASQQHTTLFSHMYGLLLGGSEKSSALTAFAATGGHGPDSAEFWEHLFLLRVESATLSRKLSALPAPLSPAHHAVLRLIFKRAAGALEDGDAHRMANACLTLEIMFDHVLAERKLPYVAAVGVICGGVAEADGFFSSLFARLHAILTEGGGGSGARANVALPSAALQTLLSVVTAEANISESIIFARLLQARFAPGADSARKAAEEEAAFAPAAAQYGGGGRASASAAAPAAASSEDAVPQSTDFFHAALAAIGTGQGAAVELAVPELVGSARGHAALSLQSDAVMLVALAAHYQRGECDNIFLAGVEKLGPRSAQQLQTLASAVHCGMRRWLADTVCALAEHEEAQAGWGVWVAGAFSRLLGYEDDGAAVVAAQSGNLAEQPNAAPAVATAAAAGGSGGTLWHGALSSILLLYELLYRNRTFTRATFELDRAQRRERVAESSSSGAEAEAEETVADDAGEGAEGDADVGSSAQTTFMAADSGLGPAARTTLVGGLLPVFYGVCGAVFVEAGRVGAAGVGLAGASGGGASVGGAAECCLATLLSLLEDDYIWCAFRLSLGEFR